MLRYSKIDVDVPDLPYQYKTTTIDYSKPNTKKDNIQMLRDIEAKYGTSIKRWGDFFELGKELVSSFIATESSGKMAAPNRFKATGLMQMTPNAVWETYKKWKTVTGKELPAEVTASLRAKTPEVVTLNAVQPSAAAEAKILKALQNDADYNIMMGAMTLRWLLERFNNPVFGGQLNKAMIAYNAGAYHPSISTGTKAQTNVVDTVRLAVSALVPSESRSYLKKMLGKDGFLALILIDKAI